MDLNAGKRTRLSFGDAGTNQLLQGGGVVVFEALDVGAAGASTWKRCRRNERERRLKTLQGRHTYDYGRVIERVTDDEAAFADEGGYDGAVCGKAHSENNGSGFA